MKSIGVFFASLVFAISLATADTMESAHSKLALVSIKTVVAEDLSHETENIFEWQALTEKGARENGSFPIVINRELTELEILSAETVKADGQRIPVHESAIVRQKGAIGQITLKDIEIVRITFPNFSTGDSGYLRYRTRNKPLFPGYVFFSHNVSENLIHDRVSIELDLPEHLAERLNVLGFIEDRNESRNGRRIRQWHYGNPEAKKTDGNQIDAALSQPHLMMTTFPSWESLARAYMDRHEPQSEPSDEIRRLAQSLTSDLSDQREKAKRIYDWVKKNIRYVAIFAGIETWVPHKADDVLANRYGDCKDHAVLLDALLRASEIASEPVLIQADMQRYRLPDVPLPAFNHVISYLPALDLYLDSTSVHTDFGRLPVMDQGKTVIRPKTTPVLDITPISSMNDRRVLRTTHTRINEKGGATRETTLRVGQDYREWFENFRQSIGPGKEKVWAQNRLDALKARGDASLVFLDDEDGLEGMRVSQTIENYLSGGETGLIAFNHAEYGPASIKGVSDLFSPKTRETAFRCQRVNVSDVVHVTLPEKFKVLRLPKNQEIQSGAISFSVDYRQEGNEYTMTRHFRWDTGASFGCTKEDWLAWLKPMRQVTAAFNSASLVFER